MHVAIEQGHHEVVAVLVQAGADVNREFNGMSPLYKASERGHYEIVELLLQAGADRAMPYQNLTPLLTATQKGHIRIVQLLMSNSLSLTVPSHEFVDKRDQVAGRKEVSAASSSMARSPRSSVSSQVYEEATAFSQNLRGEKALNVMPSAAAAGSYSSRSNRSDASKGAVSDSKSSDTERQRNSTSNANFAKGNDNFAAHKWHLALDYYKRALREIDLDSVNHYQILGTMMQIYHGGVHGVKANPDKVVRYARILEVQSVHTGMQALSFVILAECLYSGRGLPKDLTLSLEYAQKASLQPYNRVAQEQGLLLVKQITEERTNAAREREKNDREHINKITEEKRQLEEEARKTREAFLREKKEREALQNKLEQQKQMQAVVVSAAAPVSTSSFGAAAAAPKKGATISSAGNSSFAKAQSKSSVIIPRPFLLQGHTRPIACCALTPDGKWALTGSEEVHRNFGI